MNQAGAGIRHRQCELFPRPGGTALSFSGTQRKKLTAATLRLPPRNLKRAGWHTEFNLSFPESQVAILLRKKITECRDTPRLRQLLGYGSRCRLPKSQAVHTQSFCGLLGSRIEAPFARSHPGGVREIIGCAKERGAHVFAVGSANQGLDGDQGGKRSQLRRCDSPHDGGDEARPP